MNREKLKKSLTVLCLFAKIGCFTFGGGWSILAQIEQEFIDKRQYITKSDLLDLIAVGKSVPGIMIANVSLLFGYQVAGVLGGICALVGVAAPAVAILSLITLFYDVVKDNYWVACALKGLNCAVVPIIGTAAWSLGKEVFGRKGGIVICAVALAVILLTNVSNIAMIVIAIVGALIWMGVDKRDSV